MATMVRPIEDAEAEASYRLDGLAFGRSAPLDAAWLERVRSAVGLVAEIDGRMAGQLQVRPYGQLFGGRPVPMAGIASVGVAPWARGRGVALHLLDAAIVAAHDAGQVVSALYPTVPSLYRQRGWERAGVLEDMSLTPALLGSVRRSADVELRPAGPDDLADLHSCYQAAASALDGMLDRDGPSFSLPDVLGLDMVTVCPGRGYLTASRRRDRLQVHDLVALDEEVGRALLHMVSSRAGLLDGGDAGLLDALVSTCGTPRMADCF